MAIPICDIYPDYGRYWPYNYYGPYNYCGSCYSPCYGGWDGYFDGEKVAAVNTTTNA